MHHDRVAETRRPAAILVALVASASMAACRERSPAAAAVGPPLRIEVAVESMFFSKNLTRLQLRVSNHTSSHWDISKSSLVDLCRSSALRSPAGSNPLFDPHPVLRDPLPPSLDRVSIGPESDLRVDISVRDPLGEAAGWVADARKPVTIHIEGSVYGAMDGVEGGATTVWEGPVGVIHSK